MRDSVVFYRSYYEIIKELPDEQKLKLYEAIFEYAYNDNDIELEGILQGIKNLIKPNIDSANARYEASVENGKKGGRPKKENLKKPRYNLDKTPRLYLGYENEKPSQNLNDNVNDNDNVNVNDNVVVEKEKEKEKETATETAAATTTATANPKDKVYVYFQNNIDLLTEHTFEVIEPYRKKMPDELIIRAMELAIESKNRRLNYVEAILKDWDKQGIYTLLQAEEEHEEYKKKSKSKQEPVDLNRYRSDKEIDYDQFYWQG